jgi:hypothetical protein
MLWLSYLYQVEADILDLDLVASIAKEYQLQYRQCMYVFELPLRIWILSSYRTLCVCVGGGAYTHIKAKQT